MINKLLVGFGHPAHIHLFRNTIETLSMKGVETVVVISNKDILKNLVEQYDYNYYQIAEKRIGLSLFAKLYELIYSTISLNRIIRKEKPDLLVGCLTQLAFSSIITRKPSLFFGEDDFRVTRLQGLLVYPLINKIIAPKVTDVGPFRYKKISYNGYQKLAYLHPKRFVPDRSKVLIPTNEKYFIIRLSGLSAYHDKGVSGITDAIATRVINLLSKHGKVIISSERVLKEEFKILKYKGNTNDIHHYLAYAELLIGDSQTMCAEAGLLGTPYIRYNDLVDKLSYLNEIENKYGLGYGIKPNNEASLMSKIEELISIQDLKMIFHNKVSVLLKDKIDVTAFFIWIIENYPESIKILKDNPEFQNHVVQRTLS